MESGWRFGRCQMSLPVIRAGWIGASSKFWSSVNGSDGNDSDDESMLSAFAEQIKKGLSAG